MFAASKELYTGKQVENLPKLIYMMMCYVCDAYINLLFKHVAIIYCILTMNGPDSSLDYEKACQEFSVWTASNLRDNLFKHGWSSQGTRDILIEKAVCAWRTVHFSASFFAHTILIKVF